MGSRSDRFRLALLLVAIFVVVTGVITGMRYLGGPRPVADKVILISVDTLRPDFIGCYNPSILTTPSMDSLARRGVLFEDAFCNSPSTTPSHTSMLSGLYTWSHGVRRNNYRIPDEVVLLPEILKSHGWITGGFVSLTTVVGIYGFDRGFEVFDDTLTTKLDGYTYPERRCMDTIEPAIEWLSQHLNDKAFMFLHLGDPHGPYSPPEPYLKDLPPPSADKTLPIGRSNYDENAIPRYQVIGGHRETDFYIQRYHAEIRYVDDCLKLLLDKLNEWNILDHSMIILTSDHGESMGEHHKWFQHGSSLYYAQTRVPLVIVYPGIKPCRVRGIVESVDLAPTILEYLGMELPAEMEGMSFLARTRDPDQPAKSTWYGDLMGKMYGIEHNGMKLIYRNRRHDYLLFYVRSDPGEKVNIVADHPELKKALQNKLKSFIKSCRGLKAEKPRLSPKDQVKVKKALRSLGYVE